LHKAYKVSILYFSFFTLLLLVSGYMIFESKIGFDTLRATNYYLGNDEIFMAVKTNSGILKLILPHIFAFALLSMVALHFLIFTKLRDKTSIRYLVYTILIAQFFEIFSPFLIINISAFFIYIKFISFFIYLIMIPLVLLILFRSITKKIH